MPNAINVTEVQDGEYLYIVEVDITGDGSGDESGTVLIDFSAIYNPHNYQDLALRKFIANLTGFSATLLFDATTDQKFLEITEGDSGFDYMVAGGPKVDRTTTGKTGDILITTLGLGSGDCGTMRLEFKKHNGSMVS
jgi:hypothetical protein